LALSKAAEAFRNIGEVAVELGVKKHVLRFWEVKFPQLKPMKRGVDGASIGPLTSSS